MEAKAETWIAALRRSSDRLAGLVNALDTEELGAQSYDTEWSVAGVLSHLGSGAEIFGLFLDAGLGGTEVPGREAFVPVWERWNALDPRGQADLFVEVDSVLVERFESLGPADRDRFHLDLFGNATDLTGLVRMRLSEHAVHSWDVAVVRDESARVDSAAVELLVDTLPTLVARAGKSDGHERTVRVETTSPARAFALVVGEGVELSPDAGTSAHPTLSLPSEALLRLVYGRLDPAHSQGVTSDGVGLDELRPLFPGF